MPELTRRVCDVVLAEFDLDRSSLDLTDDLSADHGIDDLDLMRLAMRLEDEFHVEVKDEALQKERTLAKCVELCRAGLIMGNPRQH